MADYIRTDNVMWCSDFCIENNDVWMVHGEFNALIHLDLKTGRTEYITSVPDLISMKEFLYIRILKYKQKLVLVPYYANYLAVYDLKSQKFVYMQDIKKIYKKAIAFSDACIKNNILYCIPYMIGEPILKLDLDSLSSFEVVSTESEKLKGYIINHCALCGNYIYGAIPKSPYIIEYDIENNKVSFFKIDQVTGISGITTDNEKLYLQNIPEKTLIVWNITNQSVIEKFVLEEVSGAISVFDKNLIWIDTNKNYSNILNLLTGKVNRFIKFKMDDQKLKIPFITGPAYREGEKFYYYNRAKSSFLQYDMAWTEYNITTDFLDNDVFKGKIISDVKEKNAVIYESNCIGVIDYINIIDSYSQR